MKNNMLFAIVCTMVLASCSTLVKNHDEIGRFRIQINSIDNLGNQSVLISGENINSALWVERYEIIYSNTTAILNIYMAIRETGFSGPYHIEFSIPSSIDKIKIGNDTIWEK